MSYAVLTGVMFKASRMASKLPSMAQAALDNLASDDDTARDARLFLRSVVSGSAIYEGTKGDVCLWSTISNYGSAVKMCDHLTPFFKLVFETMAPVHGDIGHPYAPEILLFEAGEQTRRCDGWACLLNRGGTLDVRKIEIDFAFFGR